MRAKASYNAPEALSSFEETDRGLLIRDVQIMGAGDWTSMQGVRTVFTPDVLARCAGDWADAAVWTRHSGGAPRSVTDKIGTVIDPHYDPAREAVMADLLLHMRTEASREAAALVRMRKEDGGIKDVSAETMLDVGPGGIVKDITFTGLALVEDGACQTCKIPAYEAGGENMTDENTDDMKIEETPAGDGEASADPVRDLLVRALDQLIPGIGELVGSYDEASADVDRAFALGRLEQALARSGTAEASAHSKQIADLAARLAEYEKTAKPAMTASAAKPAEGGTEKTYTLSARNGIRDAMRSI